MIEFEEVLWFACCKSGESLSNRCSHNYCLLFKKNLPIDDCNLFRYITMVTSPQGANAAVKPNRALDCGAGIGRISKRLLIPLFAQVDLVEQNPTFLEQAKTYLVSSG